LHHACGLDHFPRTHAERQVIQIEKTSENFRKQNDAVAHIDDSKSTWKGSATKIAGAEIRFSRCRPIIKKLRRVLGTFLFLEDILSIREGELKTRRTQMEMQDSATNDKTFQLQRWCAKTVQRKCPDKFYTKRR
jgi:hypothetical protein